MPDHGDRELIQEHLLDEASRYKDLNRKELAAALGRDRTKLLPPTVNPTLDCLVRLAELLDRPAGGGARAVWRAERPTPKSGEKAFDDLNAAAREAHNEEVNLIVGTMGGFPRFRTTGWRILQAAVVVSSN